MAARARKGIAYRLHLVALAVLGQLAVIGAFHAHDDRVAPGALHGGEAFVISGIWPREGCPRQTARFQGATQLESTLLDDAKGLIQEEQLANAERAHMINLGQRVLDAARLEAQCADHTEGARVRTAIVRQHRGEALVARERKAVVAALEQLVPRSGHAKGAVLLAQATFVNRAVAAHRGVHHARYIACQPMKHIVIGEVVKRTLEPRQFG